ncbi:MAG: hypothetical protein HC921_18020 [Synechococcaceae cyanobacterium SM2_3_1]|nr:hypothetical protein [Synechococcaceae cyanobacterium SM2_3_1]
MESDPRLSSVIGFRTSDPVRCPESAHQRPTETMGNRSAATGPHGGLRITATRSKQRWGNPLQQQESCRAFRPVAGRWRAGCMSFGRSIRRCCPPEEEPMVAVVPYTDAGWAPLLVRFKAIVAEVGGQLSHGAILAREYGIPAVMNVEAATQRLHNGQKVRVDGSRGTVELLPGDDLRSDSEAASG